MASKKDQIIELVEGMTVLELVDLVKELEDKFGVSAAAPVAVAAMPGAAQADARLTAVSSQALPWPRCRVRLLGPTPWLPARAYLVGSGLQSG